MMIQTSSDALMDTPLSSPGLLLTRPSEPSRTSSPAPTYRSKFTAPELEGDSTTTLPLARGIDANDAHYNYETAVPYFPPPPVEKSRRSVFQKGHRAKSPSLAPFILKSDRDFETPSGPSRWPGIIRLVLRATTLILSPVLIGLLVHSLRIYYRTRDINFSGTNGSWPTWTSLFPASFLISVAALSVITSFLSLLASLRNIFKAAISTWDCISMAFSLIILALWIAGAVLFDQDNKPGKNSLVRWSCDRKNSPGNHLISYDVICGEQNAAYDISIVLAVAEALILASWVATVWSSKRSR